MPNLGALVVSSLSLFTAPRTRSLFKSTISQALGPSISFIIEHLSYRNDEEDWVRFYVHCGQLDASTRCAVRLARQGCTSAKGLIN